MISCGFFCALYLIQFNILTAYAFYLQLKRDTLKALLICTFSMFCMIAHSQERYIIGGPSPKQEPRHEASSRAIEVKNLAQRITRNYSSQSQKAKAIYNWIIATIPYDHELRFNKTLQKNIYTSEENVVKHVLSRKKALCGGYAFLYRELCEAINIKTEVIHGYTKTPGLKRKHNRVHHTWNAIKLGGDWKLVDITWAISHSNSLDNDWFGTDPKEFIKSHLPKDPKWTLLDYTLSLADFDNASTN